MENMNYDYTKSIENINKIKKIDINNESSYPKIQDLISEIITPFTTVTVPKGMTFHRARKLNKGDNFTTKKDLSYRTDLLNILDFGRANEPHQSIFYASNEVETSIFEICKLPRNIINDSKFDIVISSWVVKNNFETLVIASNKIAITKNNHIQGVFNHTMQSEYAQDINAQFISEYFSDEFAKYFDIDNSNNYKVSCAFFNEMLKRFEYKIGGIVFPSVEYEYQGTNIALLPEKVDANLILYEIGMYQLDNLTAIISPTGMGDIKNFELLRI